MYFPVSSNLSQTISTYLLSLFISTYLPVSYRPTYLNLFISICLCLYLFIYLLPFLIRITLISNSFLFSSCFPYRLTTAATLPATHKPKTILNPRRTLSSLRSTFLMIPSTAMINPATTNHASIRITTSSYFPPDRTPLSDVGPFFLMFANQNRRLSLITLLNIARPTVALIAI